MKKFVITFVVIGLVVVAIGVARRTAGSRSDGDLNGRGVIRVTRRSIGSVVKATGVIKPMVGAQVNVGSTVSGIVSRLHARIGDVVKKGQLLAELDCRELTARRDAAQAAFRLAEANLAYSETDLRRKQALHAESLISQSELDLAQQSYAVAEQQRNQARANLEDAVTQLGYARIDAPINGVVSAVSTQEGETVAASFASPTFVTLLDLSRLEVWAYVDETDIGRIQIGQKARFTVDTYGDREFNGRATAIYPKPEIRDNVVDYVTVLRFRTPSDCTLRPEMTTAVSIDLKRHENVLTLPLGVIHREGPNRFVLTRRGNAIERRSVVTGIRDESYWEIMNGLNEGAEVLAGDLTSEARQK
jgi:RND family efflux transporter MFP subunit